MPRYVFVVITEKHRLDPSTVGLVNGWVQTVLVVGKGVGGDRSLLRK
jgi:hypothetical protein